MGQKHREARKVAKAYLRDMGASLRASGWFTDEFGELRRKITKAEARRRLENSVRRHMAEALSKVVWEISDVRDVAHADARHAVTELMAGKVAEEMDAEFSMMFERNAAAESVMLP